MFNGADEVQDSSSILSWEDDSAPPFSVTQWLHSLESGLQSGDLCLAQQSTPVACGLRSNNECEQPDTQSS